MLRLELGNTRLGSIDLCLKRRLFDLIEQVALLDFATLDKQPLFEKARDPSHQRHPVHRLNPANKLIALGDLLLLGAYHADRGWPAWCRLCQGPGRKQPKRKGQQQRQGG